MADTISPPSLDEMIAEAQDRISALEYERDHLPDFDATGIVIWRAIIAQLEASRWRPIDEYPADDEGWGPNMLLFVPTGSVAPASDYRILTGRLEAEMWLGWGDDGSMYDIEGKPSYFMPLPAPPATAIEDTK